MIIYLHSYCLLLKQRQYILHFGKGWLLNITLWQHKRGKYTITRYVDYYPFEKLYPDWFAVKYNNIKYINIWRNEGRRVMQKNLSRKFRSFKSFAFAKDLHAKDAKEWPFFKQLQACLPSSQFASKIFCVHFSGWKIEGGKRWRICCTLAKNVVFEKSPYHTVQ